MNWAGNRSPETLPILERVVELAVGHRPCLEPGVEDLRHPGHGLAALSAREGDRIHDVLVEVGRAAPRFVSPTHRSSRHSTCGRSGIPTSGCTNPSIGCGIRPSRGHRRASCRNADADMLGNPMDVVVLLDQPILDCFHPHEPRGNRLVHQRGTGPVTEGVGVTDPLVAKHRLFPLHQPDQDGVGLLDVESRRPRGPRR